MEDNDDDEMKDTKTCCKNEETEMASYTKKCLEVSHNIDHTQPISDTENEEQCSKGDNRNGHETSKCPRVWVTAENFTDLSNKLSVGGEVAVVSSADEQDTTTINVYKKNDILTKEMPASRRIQDEIRKISVKNVSIKEHDKNGLSVSIRLDTDNNVEVNNNIDDIQPEFNKLSLHSPTSRRGMIKSGKNDYMSSIKLFSLYVEASCITNSLSEPELISVSCRPVLESELPSVAVPTSELDSSGHLADVSKTISTVSGSPITYIPPPPTHLSRMSYTSSTSSSSFPSSAANLAFQKMTTDPAQHISQHRINQLNKRWKNSKLIYHILDCIDRIFSERDNFPRDMAVTNIQEHTYKGLESLAEESTPVSSRKRHPSSEDFEDSIKKRLRSSSPIASTSYEEDLLGAGVFAKWQNRKYYFGHIMNILGDGRIQVVFLDRTVRVVTRDQVILELELLIGHKIMVTESSDGEEYYPGIVTNFFNDDGMFKYSVATNNGDFDVSVAQVYFTEYQAKLIKQGGNATLSAVEISGLSSLSASCSGIQKDHYDSNEMDGTSSKMSVESDVFKHVTGCDVETNDPQNLNSTVKLKNVQGKLPKRSNKNEDSLLGPLKIKGTWFKGLYFLVTCSTRTSPISNEEVHTDSEDYLFSTIPFVHDRLIQQIKLGGGQVFNKFEDVASSQYNDSYLVTNRPCLTPKYLKCLAAGIKILSHEWIVTCTIKQKRLSPLQELPAGWSVENCRFMNMYERKTTQPLSGLRIKIAQLTDQNFCKFWSDICTAVGANVSKFTGSFENTDVIVVENGFKDPKLDNATVFGIPIVSAAWIIQSLIHGELRPYEGHATYNHLYEETEEF